MESIQSIYPEGVIIHEPVEEKRLGDYSVLIKPSFEENEKLLWSIELKIKYRPRYPTRSPIFKLVELKGLSPKEVARIKEIIKTLKTKNQEDCHGWIYFVKSSINNNLGMIRADRLSNRSQLQEK